MTDYRVNLDIYNGPLDLLLYLIRRDEVDIYDIPIAGVTAQYIQYVEMIKQVDPNLAGDFLVMAATLIEIKTRMLLPTPELLESGEEGESLDPRAELVRQLLEYKAFKDAAGDLESLGEQQSQRFPRRPAKYSSASSDELDMEDVQVWDLFDAFSKVMESIGRRPTHHEVIYDDTPLELHAEDILDRLKREGPMTFTKIFAGRTRRTEVIGLFLAMLELMRQKKVFASQDENFQEIHVHVNPNPTSEDPFSDTPEDEDTEEPLADQGEYISQNNEDSADQDQDTWQDDDLDDEDEEDFDEDEDFLDDEEEYMEDDEDFEDDDEFLDDDEDDEEDDEEFLDDDDEDEDDEEFLDDEDDDDEEFDDEDEDD